MYRRSYQVQQQVTSTPPYSSLRVLLYGKTRKQTATLRPPRVTRRLQKLSLTTAVLATSSFVYQSTAPATAHKCAPLLSGRERITAYVVETQVDVYTLLTYEVLRTLYISLLFILDPRLKSIQIDEYIGARVLDYLFRIIYEVFVRKKKRKAAEKIRRYHTSCTSKTTTCCCWEAYILV